MRNYILVCIGLALGFSGGAALAQDPDPGTADPEAPAAQETQPGEKTDEAKTEESAVVHLFDRLNLQFGGSFWEVDGNRNKFEQYYTPQHGVMVRRLELLTGAPDDGLIALDLFNPGLTDTAQLLNLYSPWPVKKFKLYNTMWQGHPEFTTLDVRRERRGVDITIPMAPFFGVTGRVEEIVFSPTPGGVYRDHLTTLYPSYRETNAIIGAFATGSGYDIAYRMHTGTFADRILEQPNRTRWDNRLEISKALASSFSGLLTLDLNRTNVVQRMIAPEQGVGHNIKHEAARLELQGSLADIGAVRAYVSQVHNERSFNLTAYGRNVWSGGARIALSGLRHLFVKAGVDYRKIDYAMPDLSLIVFPRTETAWVTARFRPVSSIEVTGKWSNSVRRRLPEAGINGSAPGPSLLFRNIDKGEVGVTFTPEENYGIGYRLQGERRENPDRDMVYRTEHSDFFGWVQVNDELHLTAGYGDHLYKSTFLTFYISDARVFTAGLSYNPSDLWGIDANYFEATSRKASDVFEKAFTVSTRIRLGGISEGVLEYSTQEFNDRPAALNDYDADRVAVWWRLRY